MKKVSIRSRLASFFKKEEPGSLIVDEVGSILVMAFVFAMILAYASYSKMVQTRLAVDNIAKEYLYQMEQEGCLSNEMMSLMASDLELVGVYPASINFDGTSHTGTNQAAYGDQVTLQCAVVFDNPLYEFLSVERHSNGAGYELDENGNPTNPDGTMFTIEGLNPTISYKVNMSATAKW